MPFDDHKNFSYSTVATAPAPAISGTTLVVLAGTGSRFPAPPFNATIWPDAQLAIPTNAEIVRVTAIATDTLTITRAQEGSTARAVVVADQIAATITDKSLTDIETAITAVEGAKVAVLVSDTSVAQVVNTATETTVFTYSVPGGTLGTSGQLLLSFIAEVLQNTGGTETLTLRVKYGGTVAGLVVTGALPQNAASRALVGTFQLAAAGATNAQRSGLQATLGVPSSAAAPPTASAYETTTVPGQFASSNTGLALDSTATQALDVTAKWSTGNPGTTFKLHAVVVLKA